MLGYVKIAHLTKEKYMIKNKNAKMLSFGVAIALGSGLGLALDNILLGIGVGVAIGAALYTSGYGTKKKCD